MESPFRNTWEIYTGSFEKVLFFMLFTTLPLLILHTFITNYINIITPSFDTVYSIADIYYGIITILLFLYAQTPYVRYVYNEYTDSEKSFRNAIYQFIVNGFTIFLFASIISLLSIIGFSLFFIPGFVILSLALPVFYISIFDGKSVWKSMKEGIRLGKKHFFKIFLLILLTGLLELLADLLVINQVYNITNSLAAQIITQILLNLVFYPFFVILISSFMIKWREDQEIVLTETEAA
jgi:hypothetical protein